MRRIEVTAATTIALVVGAWLGACSTVQRSVSPGKDGGLGGSDGQTASSSSSGSGNGGAADAGDAGTGGGQDAEAGTWTPALLDQQGQVALWLEASTPNYVLSSGMVEIWKDLSQNKNDASNPQGGAAVDSAVINGHDALHFTAGNMVFTVNDATSLQFGIDQVYIAAVTKSAGTVAYFYSKAKVNSGPAGALYGGGLEFFTTFTSSDAGMLIMPAARVGTNAGDEVDFGQPVFADDKFHVVSVRRTDSATLVLQVDDLPVVMGSTGNFDVSESGLPVHIGGFHWGNIDFPVDFDLAELIVVHGQQGIIADSDVASLHAYLKQKYAL